MQTYSRSQFLYLVCYLPKGRPVLVLRLITLANIVARNYEHRQPMHVSIFSTFRILK